MRGGKSGVVEIIVEPRSDAACGIVVGIVGMLCIVPISGLVIIIRIRLLMCDKEVIEV